MRSLQRISIGAADFEQLKQPLMEIHTMQASHIDAEICLENLFYEDVVRGLTSTPKFLQSKYFYDAAGDRLFQEIMDSPEYYPTDCESDIFSRQTAGLAKAVIAGGDSCLHREYFDMLRKAARLSSRRKVVLFLGSNIG